MQHASVLADIYIFFFSTVRKWLETEVRALEKNLKRPSQARRLTFSPRDHPVMYVFWKVSMYVCMYIYVLRELS